MPPKSIMKATRKAKSKEKSRVTSSEGERRPAISKGTGVDNSVECSVCCQAIVEGKDEALFCEGECKRWMHRGIVLAYLSLTFSRMAHLSHRFTAILVATEIMLVK